MLSLAQAAHAAIATRYPSCMTLNEIEARAYASDDRATLHALQRAEEELLDDQPTREEVDAMQAELDVARSATAEAESDRDAALRECDGLRAKLAERDLSVTPAMLSYWRHRIERGEKPGPIYVAIDAEGNAKPWTTSKREATWAQGNRMAIRLQPVER